MSEDRPPERNPSTVGRQIATDLPQALHDVRMSAKPHDVYAARPLARRWRRIGDVVAQPHDGAIDRSTWPLRLQLFQRTDQPGPIQNDVRLPQSCDHRHVVVVIYQNTAVRHPNSQSTPISRYPTAFVRWPPPIH